MSCTRFLDSMKSHPRRSERSIPLLLLLLSLLCICALRQSFEPHGKRGLPCREKRYVQVSGDVGRSGVFAFCSVPSIQEALGAAGLSGSERVEFRFDGRNLINGIRLTLRREDGKLLLSQGEMNAFYKVTLGIPVSINAEPETGLTALPDIGPGLARVIVEERSKRGGFKSVEDLMSVRGIGHERFRKIKPYVTL